MVTPDLENATIAGQGGSGQLPVVKLSSTPHGQLEVGGRTTSIKFFALFQAAIDGSASPQGSSGSESRSNFFAGFFVALSNPVLRVVEQLSKAGRLDFIFLLIIITFVRLSSRVVVVFRNNVFCAISLLYLAGHLLLLLQ